MPMQSVRIARTVVIFLLFRKRSNCKHNKQEVRKCKYHYERMMAQHKKYDKYKHHYIRLLL